MLLVKYILGQGVGRSCLGECKLRRKDSKTFEVGMSVLRQANDERVPVLLVKYILGVIDRGCHLLCIR